MSDSTSIIPTNIPVEATSDQMSQNVPKCPTNHDLALPKSTPLERASANNPDPTSPLTTLQLQAISLLTSGLDLSTTAARLGIHRRTLHRWHSLNPFFRAELNRRQADLHDTAARRLRLLLLHSLQLVADQLQDESATPADRARAAQTLLRRLDLSKLLVPPTNTTDTACLNELIRDTWRSANTDPTQDVTPKDHRRYLNHLADLERQDPQFLAHTPRNDDASNDLSF